MEIFMKKYFFVLVALSVPFFIDAVNAMDSLDTETLDFRQGVRKINDNLYTCEYTLPNEEKIHFVMERTDANVPNSRLGFWQEYVKAEKWNYSEYAQMCYDGKIPRGKGFLIQNPLTARLIDGITSFETSVNNYYSNNQLWIAYTSTKDIETAGDITRDEIEMAVTVLTDKDSPMVTHIGIGRSYHYLLQAAEAIREGKQGFKLHSNLSMFLHSFAARVIRMTDPEKLYMITAPVPAMRDIMLKVLPHNAYVGSTYHTARDLHRSRPKSAEYQSLMAARQKADEEEQELREQIQNLNDDTLEAQQQEEELTKASNEKAQLRRTLWKAMGDLETKEINEIAEKLKLEMTVTSSPIHKTNRPYAFEVFDKKRENVFFSSEGNLNSKVIKVKNQVLKGEDTRRFDWFDHHDLAINPYVTIDLDALSLFMVK